MPAEISQKGRLGKAPMNTPRISANHVSTMEDLLAAMQRFVAEARKGKVVSLEEVRMLREAQREMECVAAAAADEAVMIDYVIALMGCTLKQNGPFGQRYMQLFEEAERFRAGYLERQARREGVDPEPSGPAALMRRAA